MIKGQETAKNGDRVVAMLDGEVTLKRLQKTKDRLILYPANGDLQPIEVKQGSEIRIIGVLLGVIRKC